MILIVGGEPETLSVELITDDDFKRIDLPKLPKEIVGPSLIKHNNVILSCGGEKSGANQECFKLTSDGWCHPVYIFGVSNVSISKVMRHFSNCFLFKFFNFSFICPKKYIQYTRNKYCNMKK